MWLLIYTDNTVRKLLFQSIEALAKYVDRAGLSGSVEQIQIYIEPEPEDPNKIKIKDYRQLVPLSRAKD